jgi:hypothetical protein
MENEDSKAELNRYEFLYDKRATKFFARLDYLLKSGMHVQRYHPAPEGLYRFLDTHFVSLKDYYFDFFDLILERKGEHTETYYYLDFVEGSRGNIPNSPKYREYLKTEYILVGMLFFKVYKLDANIELNKISDFINLLYQEYDEIVQKLQWFLGRIVGEAASDFSDEKLRDITYKAFAEFEELGWVSRDEDDKDYFTYHPSFERLRRLYYPQINSIDELLSKPLR